LTHFHPLCVLSIPHSTLKQARTDLAHLQATIAAMPLSREQYLEQEAELVAFLQEEKRVDWTQPKLAPVPIEGVFDPTAEIRRVEKAGAAKFMSAEEEATQRKLEMERMLSRKAEPEVAVAQEGDDSECAAVATAAADGADSVREGCATPAFGASTSVTAPNTEYRRLSVAATAMFSPGARGAAAEIAAVCDFATPRKRNSVLLSANPDMLNKLNFMLMNSPTPMKASGRASIMPMSAIKASVAAGDSVGKLLCDVLCDLKCHTLTQWSTDTVTQ
jgi:hypothetical protein